MKQVIVDGHFVKQVNIDIEEPITIGISVPDDLEISVGQWLEDDLTVREVTNEEIAARFASSLTYKFNKSMLISKLTEEEFSFLITKKTDTIAVEVLWETLNGGGVVDLKTSSILIDNEILTVQRQDEITGIKYFRDFLNNGMEVVKEEV
jgi:hypothetical protein